MAEITRKTILVVEDDPDVALLLDYRLRALGYIVMRVNRGSDVMRVVREIPPDLILLDLMLPGLDGIGVLRLLRGTPQTEKIPVLVVTALSDSDIHSRAQKAGATEVLVKQGFLKSIGNKVSKLLPLAA